LSSKSEGRRTEARKKSEGRNPKTERSQVFFELQLLTPVVVAGFCNSLCLEPCAGRRELRFKIVLPLGGEVLHGVIGPFFPNGLAISAFSHGRI
jgi:hypothetical protein